MRKFIYRLRGLLALRIRKDFNFRRVQETIPAIRWLRPKRGERILDIGCGEGSYNYRIGLQGAYVLGFDLNRPQLRRAIDYHKTSSTSYFCADAGILTLHSGQFDTVMSVCVFEHLQNDRDTLNEIWRVLRPGGRILLTLDSLTHKSIDDTWRDLHRKRHSVVQFYSHGSVAVLLEESGFKLNRYQYLLRSRFDLLLIRLSYTAEHMHTVPATLIRLGLISIGRMVSAVLNLFTENNRGWTLLVEASKESQ